MKINDKVYGVVIINEPILIELIHSKPIQRLKGINQAGASQYALKIRNVTRYEHSLGVMILLKMLGATLEEQIAGLLHDIPHTAFSHVIDFVFKNKNNNQEFHENFYKKILLNSEIPIILKKFGFKVGQFLDVHNFPLLERKIPYLCADRIDYTLRDMVATNGWNSEVTQYISSFIVYKDEIIMKNGPIAKKFAEDYLTLDEKIWSNPMNMALNQILADAIKIGLKKKILCEDDLFKDDLYVYKRLKQSKNTIIMKKLAMISKKLKIIDDQNQFDFYTKSKVRHINPPYLNQDGSVSRVTDKFKDFSKRISLHKTLIKRGNFVKIVSH